MESYDYKTSSKTSKVHTYNKKYNEECQAAIKESIENGTMKVWKMSEKEKAYYDSF